MIHSLAGGILNENKPINIAKVEIVDDYYCGTFWYVNEILNLKENDFVVVPFGKQNVLVKGKVLKIEKHVSPQASPIPLKHLKKIVSIKK